MHMVGGSGPVATVQSSRQAEIYYFGDVMSKHKMERLRCVWLLVKNVLLYVIPTI